MIKIPKVEASPEFALAGTYLTHLIFCGLHGESPRPLPEGITWEDVLWFARKTATEGVSWYAAQTCGDVPEEVRKVWQATANMTFYRMIMFAQERENIFAALSERGISYLPLKGALLAEYYPQPGMRSMCDNDILYGFTEKAPEGGYRIRGASEEERSQAEAEAERIMTEVLFALGFAEGPNVADQHETFVKQSGLSFELHRSLKDHVDPHADYYRNSWQRALPDEDDPFLFRFSDEDEYLYFFSHAYRHLSEDGIGIRYLVDAYVLLERKGSCFDWDYVNGELAVMDMVGYERAARELAYAVFGDEAPLSAEQENLLLYFLGCDVHGTVQERYRIKVQNFQDQIQESGDSAAGGGLRLKWRYALDRMRIDEDAMRKFFPFFYEHKALRPLLPFYRLGKFLTRNSSHAKAEKDILLGGGEVVSFDLERPTSGK